MILIKRKKQTIHEEKTITIFNSPVLIQKKNMKSLRMRMIPPHGELRVSAPLWYKDDEIRNFIESRWDWVIRQKANIQSVHPLARQNYMDGNPILFQGQYLLLQTIPQQSGIQTEKKNDRLIVPLKKTGDEEECRKKVENWYRSEMKLESERLIHKWASVLNVKPAEWRIKKMTTRWGTCNVRAGRIWLNLELITMKMDIMEYVVVHELAHLIEPSHNKRFKEILTQVMPDWKSRSRKLKGNIPL